MGNYFEPVLSEEQMAAYLDGMLSTEENKLNEYLSRIRKQADTRYTGANPYGIIEWEDEEDIDLVNEASTVTDL